MPEQPIKSMPSWVLPALSWVVSLYFLCSFAGNVGFPPDRQLLTGDALYVFLWLFFLFLPFYTKVKIGSFLELERKITKAKVEVAHAKDELREFKAEVRNNLSVLSTNVNTIGGMTNQVTVNIPGVADLKEARRQVAEKAPEHNQENAGAVEERLLTQSEDDLMFALVRTRVDIERLLRKIVGKTTSLTPNSNTRFLGITSLFKELASQNSDVRYLETPLRYVVKLCNAAVHGQAVSTGQASEALSLGAEIIAALKSLAGGTDDN